MARRGLFLVVFLAVAALYLTGRLDAIERALLDTRMHLDTRSATGSIVLVEIDRKSLEALEVWPWPRRRHGQLIAALESAGVETVAFDVDFSNRSNPTDDRALATALRRTEMRVLLPAFQQYVDGPAGEPRLAKVTPIRMLRGEATLASINVQPSPDGLIRALRVRERWGDGVLPTLSTLLAPRAQILQNRYFVDYGIDPKTVPRVSYVDVLRGETPGTLLEDRSVVVGATAIELGDQLAVPVHKALPGALVQILGAESLKQERTLTAPAGFPGLVAAFLLTAFMAWRFDRMGWRAMLAVSFGAVAGAYGAALGLHMASATVFHASPAMLAATLGFVLTLVLRVDQQTLRLMFQSLEIRRQDERMRNVVENSFDGIVTLDDAGRIQSANPAAAAMFQYEPDAMVGMTVDSLLTAGADTDMSRLAPPRAHRVGRLEWIAGIPMELVGWRRDGRDFPAEVAFTEVGQGDARTITAFIRDVTWRKRRQAEIEQHALYDALTGLPNRALLFGRLDEALRRGRREETGFALLLLDLNRFKEINDALGHHVGDRMLQLVGTAIQESVRESDTVARLGGDEFAILLPGVDQARAAERIARKIAARLRRPVSLESVTLHTEASIGLCLFPEHGQDAGQLVRFAEMAMYTAKSEQRSYALYDPGSDSRSPKTLALGVQIQGAIDDGQIALVLQPMVDLSDGRIHRVEALVRWDHPELGRLTPDRFIALAEENGAIQPLTQAVIEQAIALAGELAAAGETIGVAVNLSARNLHDPDLLWRTRGLLFESGLDPAALTFEITETAIMVDAIAAMRVLSELDGLGVRIAIDDFGTGYSSLAYLRDLPADELKIDRSFVTDMDEDERKETIVRSTVDLAHSLGLSVTAEGIENAAVYQRLRTLGCNKGQGYYIARPMTAADLRQWLGERAA